MGAEFSLYPDSVKRFSLFWSLEQPLELGIPSLASLREETKLQKQPHLEAVQAFWHLELLSLKAELWSLPRTERELMMGSIPLTLPMTTGV